MDKIKQATGMTVEQHLRRYHKKWLEEKLEEAKEITKREFIANKNLRLMVPMLLPQCKYFEERLSFVGWTTFTFVWNPNTNEVELES